MVRWALIRHHAPSYPQLHQPTRLNSTLCVRINAQIPALHIDNLHLRTPEIAIGSQLKKEWETSQHITDAESAVRFHRFHPAFPGPIPSLATLFQTVGQEFAHSH